MERTHHPIICAMVERNRGGVGGKAIKWGSQLTISVDIQRPMIVLPELPASNDLSVVEHVHCTCASWRMSVHDRQHRSIYFLGIESSHKEGCDCTHLLIRSSITTIVVSALNVHLVGRCEVISSHHLKS